MGVLGYIYKKSLFYELASSSSLDFTFLHTSACAFVQYKKLKAIMIIKIFSFCLLCKAFRCHESSTVY
jgi:hypothetical protein